VASDTIACDEKNSLEIGNDVWIGASSIILPRCRKIGDGAVIGAGTIVTRDVPEYSVVVGNPAKVIGSRFSNDLQLLVKKTRWWTRDVEELLPLLSLFTDEANEELATKLLSELEIH
jgi:serine acetyltransferase